MRKGVVVVNILNTVRHNNDNVVIVAVFVISANYCNFCRCNSNNIYFFDCWRIGVVVVNVPITARHKLTMIILLYSSLSLQSSSFLLSLQLWSLQQQQHLLFRLLENRNSSRQHPHYSKTQIDNDNIIVLVVIVAIIVISAIIATFVVAETSTISIFDVVQGIARSFNLRRSEKSFPKQLLLYLWMKFPYCLAIYFQK
jgi:hypothetical protein